MAPGRRPAQTQGSQARYLHGPIRGRRAGLYVLPEGTPGEDPLDQPDRGNHPAETAVMQRWFRVPCPARPASSTAEARLVGRRGGPLCVGAHRPAKLVDRHGSYGRSR